MPATKRSSVPPTVRTRTIITKTIEEYTIAADQLRQALNLPARATLFVHVPGGGDWSNTDIELDNRDDLLHVRIETTETKEE